MLDYRLYHDESKRAGYWHGMLLVPEESRSELLTTLERVRTNTRFPHVLAIKGVERHSGRKFRCAQSWILLAIGHMRCKLGTVNYQVHYGEKRAGKLIYDILKTTLGLKFILFREKQNHEKMELIGPYAKKVETTFRMGLKGGLNYLSSEDQKIRIIKMHFDGNKHHNGGIDRDRVIGRLNGLNESCSIKNAEDMIDDRCGDHNRGDSQEYGDCQLLQLTDLLVGSFRTLLGECTKDIHKKLAKPVGFPIEAFLRPYKGFMNSRWFGSFCMSQCEIIEDRWVFSTPTLSLDTNEVQFDLPFDDVRNFGAIVTPFS